MSSGEHERLDQSTWLIFDGYGSLIDWEGGMASFLYAVALRSGDDAPPRGDRLFAEWAGIRRDLMQEPFRPYKDILSLSLQTWCQRMGYEWSSGYGGAAKTAMRSFQPFPEAVPVLRRALAGGHKLALIADTDHDIINHSLNQMPVEFEEVIVSEDCLSYKPSPQNFTLALERTGTRPADILYIGTDFEIDITPARQSGMRTAWLVRSGQETPDDLSIDHIWRDLWQLADQVAVPEEVNMP